MIQKKKILIEIISTVQAGKFSVLKEVNQNSPE